MVFFPPLSALYLFSYFSDFFWLQNMTALYPFYLFIYLVLYDIFAAKFDGVIVSETSSLAVSSPHTSFYRFHTHTQRRLHRATRKRAPAPWEKTAESASRSAAIDAYIWSEHVYWCAHFPHRLRCSLQCYLRVSRRSPLPRGIAERFAIVPMHARSAAVSAPRVFSYCAPACSM